MLPTKVGQRSIWLTPAIPVFGTQLVDIINRYYDNSLQNVGNHDS